MKSIENMDYWELYNLSEEIKSRMDEMDAADLSKIEITPEEYHTLETKGSVEAEKQLRARTNCRLRVAILAIRKAEGVEITFV